MTSVLILAAILSSQRVSANETKFLNSVDLRDGKIHKYDDDPQLLSGRLVDYWHCLNTNFPGLKVFCEDWGTHETEGPKGMFGMYYKKNGVRHDFVPRHAEPLMYCACKVKLIKKIMRETNHICVLGEGFSFSPDDLKKKEFIWILRAIKDDKGRRRNEDDLCD